VPLTSAGLELPLVETLVAAVEARLRAALGEGLGTGPRTVVGQLNGVFSSQVRDVLELVADVYDSYDPDLAAGAALDRLCALTGTARLAASQSTVTVSVTLSAGATVAPGDLVLSVVGSPESTFANRDELANPSGIQAVVSGVFLSVENGAIEAPAGSLTVISQPAAGVVSATNPADAVPGREVESDADLRSRRERELFRPGSSTVDAITVDVADADDVIVQVKVFENVTDETDADGLPPHSIEVMVYDGTSDGSAVSDDVIAQAVWEAKPGGIRSFGSITADATDANGETRSVQFSRPTALNLFVRLTLSVTDDWLGTDDEDEIKDRVAEFGRTLGTGDDVVLSRLTAYVLRGDDTPDAGAESRILDVVSIKVDTVNPPVATGNYVTNARELPVLDTSRVSFVYV
jgi:hypothetical protein